MVAVTSTWHCDSDLPNLNVTEMQALEERQKTANAYTAHPALLRLEELTTLRDLARNANARLYLDFKEKPALDGKEE